MRTRVLTWVGSVVLSLSAGAAFAQVAIAPIVPLAVAAPVLCDACGVVQDVRQESRKGKGGAMGKVGGAVAGGVLGNQVGGGDGKTVATVAGAVGGAVLGNEIQKRMTKRMVWVTTVKMKDGTNRLFEQDAQPGWKVYDTVKADGNNLVNP